MICRYWLVLKIAHVVKVDGCRLTKIGHVSLGLLAAGLVCTPPTFDLSTCLVGF